MYPSLFSVSITQITHFVLLISPFSFLGVLLHFDDPSLKLTDCYFIHPEWLSQMMAQVVTVREINPFVNENGVLNRENLPILFKGGNFPEAFIDSYLRYALVSLSKQSNNLSTLVTARHDLNT